MGSLKNRQGCQWLMHFLFVKLAAWFGWLPMALSQLELSEAVSSSVSFMDAGIVSLGHIAVFATTVLRGRLDLEMGARDVLATIRGPKLEDINGFGFTTDSDLRYASVVMLSTHIHNSSMKQFMKYLSGAHDVDSVLLQCLPLRSAAMTIGLCGCKEPCHCIVFWTVDAITVQLALRMPGTLKKLSESLCLLPSLQCLKNGCHGCNVGLLHVEIEEFAQERLIEGDAQVSTPAAACQTLDIIARSIEEKPTCLCIPILSLNYDDWTRLLIRCFKCADEDSRGARVTAIEALESYLDETRGGTVERVEYSTASLIVPRIIEILVNIVLTGLFRVDGFSSALTARRAMRDYIVDSRGNGFFANVFFTKALVNASATNSHICQVLTFRHPLMSLRALTFLAGGMNLICTLWWSLAIAFGAGLGKWSDTYSMHFSKVRFFAVMAAIGIGLGLDCLHLYLNRFRWRELPLIWAVIILEILCIAAAGTVAGILGVKAFGTWLYSALQGMVWVKWGFGSYLLGEYLEDESRWAESGILVYSSAFLLSAILAGVGGRWQ
eukprot:Gb_27442 [translate_table: standard]